MYFYYSGRILSTPGHSVGMTPIRKVNARKHPSLTYHRYFGNLNFPLFSVHVLTVRVRSVVCVKKETVVPLYNDVDGSGFSLNDGGFHNQYVNVAHLSSSIPPAGLEPALFHLRWVVPFPVGLWGCTRNK